MNHPTRPTKFVADLLEHFTTSTTYSDEKKYLTQPAYHFLAALKQEQTHPEQALCGLILVDNIPHTAIIGTQSGHRKIEVAVIDNNENFNPRAPENIERTRLHVDISGIYCGIGWIDTSATYPQNLRAEIAIAQAERYTALLNPEPLPAHPEAIEEMIEIDNTGKRVQIETIPALGIADIPAFG